MELRQLQHFVAVAEERHFTRAAQRVNIVQSALSSSIRLLEEELDAKLFVRSTRQVRLTSAGLVFLDKARKALEAVNDAREAVAAVEGLKLGTLSIGTVQSLPAFLDLPSLIARFHAAYPGIEIRLSQGSSTDLLEKIRTGRLDLAFLPFFDLPDDIETAIIACETLVLACSINHPLAGHSKVKLTELRDLPFVDFAPDWGTRRLVDNTFADARIDRRIAFEVSDLDTLMELVARGLGVALLPETILETRRPHLGVAQLAEPKICWELVVVHLAGGSPNAGSSDAAPKAFLQLLNGAA